MTLLSPSTLLLLLVLTLRGTRCHLNRRKNFNSIQLFISFHTAIQFYTDYQVIYGINKLYKMSSCFHYNEISLIIHDIISIICMSCGNREGISGLFCSTLKKCRCSVLYSIIIYIYSHQACNGKMKDCGKKQTLHERTFSTC